MTRKKKSTDPLRNKKEWSISEFQMWLHGAFSLQGEDWLPNAEQWETIVGIIYKLKDEEPEATYDPPPQAAPVRRNSSPPGAGYMVPQQPVAEPPAMSDGDISNPNPPFTPPEAELPLSELRKMSEQGGTSSGGRAIKTANIDTSKGYKSSFE